ncbi:hypothetical protein IJL65_02965 [bacterium]|nr:hypothetical protein [bacterium]
MSGCEYRVYQVLKGIIDEEEEEKKVYEGEISVIQTMLEQLKKELSLKKFEELVMSQRKSAFEVLDTEV